jgi:glyoxylase-like metal-dependent hydrolase (beta-lactamase superfamily II)
MKKVIVAAVAAVSLLILAGGVYFGYQYHCYNRTIVVDSRCRVVMNEAGNSLLLTSDDGKRALLVDTKKGGPAAKLPKLVGTADLLIVNTHAHSDHTAGNALYGNTPIVGGPVSPGVWKSESENSPYPTETLLPGQEKTVTIGSETVRIRNTGMGHTGNDLIVFLEKRRLLAAGDLLFPSIHPVLFPTSGGNVGAWIRTLDSLIADTAITTIVPGHGAPVGREALVKQREYFTSIVSAIDDKEALAACEKRYKGFYAVPGLSSFEKTVAFVRREQGGEE